MQELVCTNLNKDSEGVQDIENLNFLVPRKDVSLPMIDSPWDYLDPVTQFLDNIERVLNNQESLALYMREEGSLKSQELEATLRQAFEDKTRHVLEIVRENIPPFPIEEDMDKEEETLLIAYQRTLELEQRLVSVTCRLIAVRKELAERIQAFRDRRDRKTALNTARSPETSNNVDGHPQPDDTPENTQRSTVEAAVQTDLPQPVSALSIIQSISTSPGPRVEDLPSGDGSREAPEESMSDATPAPEQIAGQTSEHISTANTSQDPSSACQGSDSRLISLQPERPEEGRRDAASGTEPPDTHLSNTAHEESCANSIIHDPQGDIPYARQDCMDVDEPGEPVIQPWLGQSNGLIIIDQEDNRTPPTEANSASGFDFSRAHNRDLSRIPVSTNHKPIDRKHLEMTYGVPFTEHLRAQGKPWKTVEEEYALKFGVFRTKASLQNFRSTAKNQNRDASLSRRGDLAPSTASDGRSPKRARRQRNLINITPLPPQDQPTAQS